jgi:1-acyl-sn-glycerol-3-phosphate acyltransferase
MIYTVLRIIARISLKIYFKKIYLSGFAKIPTDRPTIYICNHPNGFFEPCVIACFFPQKLHYLVRGDLFSNPILKWLLQVTHQIPIFRFKDGFSNMKRNNETIENCYNILRDNKSILIFAEGSTEQVRWIRPLQKGTARIALGTMATHSDISIKIVPVSIHFTEPMKPRSEVMIHVGDPISIDSYIDDFSKNPPATVKKLTEDLYPKLRDVCIHCTYQEDAEIIEHSIRLFAAEHLSSLQPIVQMDTPRYKDEYNRVKKLNSSIEQEKNELRKLFKEYHSKLIGFATNDIAVMGVNFNPLVPVLYLIGLPIFLLGLVLCILPVVAANYIAKKYVVYKEFHSSIFISAVLGISILYILIAFFIALFIYGPYAIFIFFLPMLGYLTIIYWESINQYLKNRNFKKLNVEDKENLKQMRSLAIHFFNK